MPRSRRIAAVLLCPLVVAGLFVSAALAYGPPQRLAAGRHIYNPRLSANGDWLLFSEDSTVGFGGHLHVWHQGGSLRTIGPGGHALAISNDGQEIEYQCAPLTVCLRRTNGSSFRRVTLPCSDNTRPLIYPDSQLSSLLVGCEAKVLSRGQPEVVTKVFHIGPASAKVTARFTNYFPVGIGSNGANAILNDLHDRVYLYRRGHLRQVSSRRLDGISSNARFAGIQGPSTMTVPCREAGGLISPGCFEQKMLPTIVDLQTGAKRALSLGVGTPSQISDDGRFVLSIYNPHENEPPCEAPCDVLKVTDGITGQETTVYVSPGKSELDARVMSADASTVAYAAPAAGGEALFVATAP